VIDVHRNRSLFLDVAQRGYFNPDILICECVPSGKGYAQNGGSIGVFEVEDGIVAAADSVMGFDQNSYLMMKS
jgi:hypothetical protein